MQKLDVKILISVKFQSNFPHSRFNLSKAAGILEKLMGSAMVKITGEINLKINEKIIEKN